MIYFKAFKFNGKKSAGQALDNMEISDTTLISIKEEDVAQITVDSFGIYSIQGSWTQNYNILSDGIAYRTPLSNVLGIIFGPTGAFYGVSADESVTNLVGHMDNIEIRDQALSSFADTMHSNTSALVVLGDESIIDAFTEELIEYEPETFELKLEDEIDAAIRRNV